MQSYKARVRGRGLRGPSVCVASAVYVSPVVETHRPAVWRMLGRARGCNEYLRRRLWQHRNTLDIKWAFGSYTPLHQYAKRLESNQEGVEAGVFGNTAKLW